MLSSYRRLNGKNKGQRMERERTRASESMKWKRWTYLDGMDFIILAISDSFTYQFCLAIFFAVRKF